MSNYPFRCADSEYSEYSDLEEEDYKEEEKKEEYKREIAYPYLTTNLIY